MSVKIHFGSLFRLRFHGERMCFELLCHDEDRERAKTIAKLAMTSPDWIGIRQVLFIDRGGSIELWNERIDEFESETEEVKPWS